MRRLTKSDLNSQADGIPSSQGSSPIVSPVLTRVRSALLLIALEDRVLYNAVPLAAVELVQSATETTNNSLHSIDDRFDSIELAISGVTLIGQDRIDHWEITSHDAESFESGESTSAMATDVAVSDNASAQDSLPTSALIVMDTSLNNYQTLLDSVTSQIHEPY